MDHSLKASDFETGKVLHYGPYTVTKEEIIEFATEFDPACFHLDEEAAKSSMLGGLAASGFHTCAISMRMMCDAYLLQSPSQGSPGVEEIVWHKPVRPGDTLHGTSTIISARPSASRPDMMILKLHHETFNQKDEVVLSMLNTGFMRIEGEMA